MVSIRVTTFLEIRSTFKKYSALVIGMSSNICVRVAAFHLA